MPTFRESDCPCPTTPECSRVSIRCREAPALHNRAGPRTPLRTSRRLRGVSSPSCLFAFSSVAEQDMRQFVEACLVGSGFTGLTAMVRSCAYPNVLPLSEVELDFLHVEGSQCPSASHDRRSWSGSGLPSVCARTNQNGRYTNHVAARVSSRAVVGGRGALDRDGPTQRDGLLATTDESPQFLPALERGDGSRLNATSETLREGEQHVPEAVAVELPICTRQDAGFVDGVFEKLSECCGGRCCHLVLHLEGQRAAAIMAGAVSQSSLVAG